MEIHDDTEVLRRLFLEMEPASDDVESVHRAELDPATSLLLMANPKAALKAMNIPVSDESQVQITMKNRADRTATDTLAMASAARLRRIIVIVIHYRNCDADIIIIATR